MIEFHERSMFDQRNFVACRCPQCVASRAESARRERAKRALVVHLAKNRLPGVLRRVRGLAASGVPGGCGARYECHCAECSAARRGGVGAL